MSPCPEDIEFAKSKVVAKRNRYKDKFPCELGMNHTHTNFLVCMCISYLTTSVQLI